MYVCICLSVEDAAHVGACVTVSMELRMQVWKTQFTVERIKIEAKQREREPKAQSLDKIKAEAELNASEARLLAEKQQQGETELATAERELQAHDEAVERSGQELSACEAERAALQRREGAASATCHPLRGRCSRSSKSAARAELRSDRCC